MRIGILTYHNSINYGAFLQAYALVKVIQERFDDSQAEIINYDSVLARKASYRMILSDAKRGNLWYGLVRHLTFRRESHILPVGKRKCITNSMKKFELFVSGQYDVIVTGSDQIWKLDSFRGFPSAYWLPVDGQAAKMSYAASSRSIMTSQPQEVIDRIISYMNDFEYIGVRDELTGQQLKAINPGLNIYQNCDPVFLYDFKSDITEYKAILKNRYGITNDKPCIGFMMRDERILNELRQKYKDTVNYISLYIPHKGTYKSPQLTPFEFAAVVMNLDFIVTSYFHGLCFAIKGNTPFIAYEKRLGENIGNSKMYDLLVKLNLTERYRDSAHGESLDFILNVAANAIKERERCNFKDGIKKLVQQSDTFFEAMKKEIHQKDDYIT